MPDMTRPGWHWQRLTVLRISLLSSGSVSSGSVSHVNIQEGMITVMMGCLISLAPADHKWTTVTVRLQLFRAARLAQSPCPFLQTQRGQVTFSPSPEPSYLGSSGSRLIGKYDGTAFLPRTRPRSGIFSCNYSTTPDILTEHVTARRRTQIDVEHPEPHVHKLTLFLNAFYFSWTMGRIDDVRYDEAMM
jgi:hypothetical protein